MPARPWFPFYPSDYFGDTPHLSIEEHGAYLLLLFRLWNSGGYLTYDRRELQQLWGVTPQRTTKIWAKISPFFDQKTEKNGLEISSNRLLKEMRKAEHIQEVRAEHGRKGGLAKARRLLEQNPSIPQPHTTEEKNKTPPIDPPRAEKPPPARSTRGTRLPDNWTPSEDCLNWARENGNGLDVSREADRFRDYWIAQPGQKGVKVNWTATWRNWIRRAQENGHAGNRRSNERNLSAVERVERANKLGRWAEPRGRTFDGEVEQ